MTTPTAARPPTRRELEQQLADLADEVTTLRGHATRADLEAEVGRLAAECDDLRGTITLLRRLNDKLVNSLMGRDPMEGLS